MLKRRGGGQGKGLMAYNLICYLILAVVTGSILSRDQKTNTSIFGEHTMMSSSFPPHGGTVVSCMRASAVSCDPF